MRAKLGNQNGTQQVSGAGVGEFPTYVYLLARSLERTVWEDPSRDTCVEGHSLYPPNVRHGSLSFLPPVCFPPRLGPALFGHG